jgi:hypothetical protein
LTQQLHNYAVHGLRVRSAIVFPGLTFQPGNPFDPQVTIKEPQPSNDHDDDVVDHKQVVLHTGWCEIVRHTASTLNTDVHAESQTYSMSYPLHGFTFLIKASPNHVRIQPRLHHDKWAEMLPIMARGAVLTFACRLLGFPALHANTVCLNGETIAFAGESGAGKTLTSALALVAGADLVSDDVTVVDDVGIVHPGLLEVRLRVDDSLGRVVGGLLGDLPGVDSHQTADERSSFRFSHVKTPTPKPLTRVMLPYLDAAADRFTLELISPPDAVMSLLKANRLVGWVDAAFQRSDFAFAAFVAEWTQVHRLRMPMIFPDARSVRLAAQELVELMASTRP